MVTKPETRELWWRGVAPKCRSIVWEKALGNNLSVTEETFRLALSRARDLEKGKGSIQNTKQQEMFQAIRRDVDDTFPELRIFQVSFKLDFSGCHWLITIIIYYIGGRAIA